MVGGWVWDGRRFWAAELAGVKTRRWDFRALLVDGEVRQRARWPQRGELEHQTVFDVRWMSTTAGGWERKPTKRELTTMVFRRGDVGEWLVAANAEIQVFHMWDESIVGVKSVDFTSRTIRFRNPSGHPPGGFGVKRYAVWNVRKGMTAPGQWYLDRVVGKVVYWPMPGEDMAEARVIAPTTETVIRLAGSEDAPVAGVRLRGLGTPIRGALR